jgi:hypothetical protein
MDIIKPIEITEAKLTSSSVVEDDYAEWSSATAYVAGDYCMIETLHRVYLCEADSTDNYPPDNIYDPDADPVAGNWTDVGATNRWRMFDGLSRSATIVDGAEIAVEIVPGEHYNAVAMLNIEADLITILVEAGSDGNVYQQTINTVDNAGIVDFYSWFFNPIQRKINFVVAGLPAYIGSKVKITFYDSDSAVAVGECIVGTSKFIGTLLHGYTVGVEDYSIKEKDDFGNWIITEGAYADRGEFTLRMRPERIYDVKKTLAAYRSTPLVYVGDVSLQETIIYGFFISFDIEASSNSSAYCSLEIEEIS